MKRVVVLPAALTIAVGLAVALTGCGSDPDSGSGHGRHNSGDSSPTAPASPGKQGGKSGEKTNSEDTKFSLAMIPHHGQAIEMSDQALAKATNPKVRKLATDIKAAQDPEIRLMSGWLKSWNVPVPEPSMDMSEHKGHAMEGMMSYEQMQKLDKAKGRAYDKLWVEMMIEHHEGAVTMSQKELKDGAHPASKKLARAIIKGQTTEIKAMQAMLPSL